MIKIAARVIIMPPNNCTSVIYWPDKKIGDKNSIKTGISWNIITIIVVSSLFRALKYSTNAKVVIMELINSIRMLGISKAS